MSKALQATLGWPTASLTPYEQASGNVPVLSASEERALAIRLREDGDLEAARRLVLSNLRFVMHVARGYRGYGLPFADLVQEGSIGLMKAVKRFDPEVGVRLVSFAVHWIRAEIHEFILRNWRIVKVATTKAQRKLFFKLRSSKKRLGWMNQAEVEAVAEDLGVPAKTVLEMEKRLSAHDAAYDAHPDQDGDEERFTPAAYLEDRRFDPAREVEENDWSTHNLGLLNGALDELDERSRDIVQRRWLSEDKETLMSLAEKYQVSAERIRQLENNAIKKMRKVMVA